MRLLRAQAVFRGRRTTIIPRWVPSKPIRACTSSTSWPLGSCAAISSAVVPNMLDMVTGTAELTALRIIVEVFITAADTNGIIGANEVRSLLRQKVYSLGWSMDSVGQIFSSSKLFKELTLRGRERSDRLRQMLNISVSYICSGRMSWPQNRFIKRALSNRVYFLRRQPSW